MATRSSPSVLIWSIKFGRGEQVLSRTTADAAILIFDHRTQIFGTFNLRTVVEVSVDPREAGLVPFWRRALGRCDRIIFYRPLWALDKRVSIRFVYRVTGPKILSKRAEGAYLTIQEIK